MRVHHKVWKAVLVRDNWRCRYCDEDLLVSLLSFDSATVDHVVPVSAGGTDQEDNLVAACSGCNLRLSRCTFTTFEERKTYVLAKRQLALVDLKQWQDELRPSPLIKVASG